MALTGTLDAHFTVLWDGGHIKFWSRKTLTTLLEDYGYAGQRFYGAGRLPWLWKSMILASVKK
jgi:2-polyprenyl-6-hydroxyphenyl methylase/3-demethylubiquinone-9 3-methyltransferase